MAKKREKPEKRKRVEEATKLAYAELNQIFNTAADGMRVIDKEFNVLRINETFSTLAGVSEDEALDKKCYEVLRGPLCHTPNCPLTQILGGEERVECEVEKERKDGIRVPCILTATPFRGPGRELIGIVEDFKDITERKRAEEEIRRRGEELAALNAIAMTVTSTLDLQEVLQTIQERVMELFDEAYPPLFFLFNEEDQTFKMMATRLQEQGLRVGEKLTGVKLEKHSFPLPASRSQASATRGLVGGETLSDR